MEIVWRQCSTAIHGIRTNSSRRSSMRKLKKLLPLLLLSMLGCQLGAFNDEAKKPQLPAPPSMLVSDVLTITVVPTSSNGVTPLTVNLVGAIKSSANSPTTWYEWTFGDGSYC